jgi:hypothetical protein
VYMCLGRRPIPIGAEIARTPPQEVHKVALGPSATEADAHTFASLRSLQPCVLPFVLSRAALLTRPCPAQPLLLTADSAGSSVYLSPIGVTIAAARPCMFIEYASAQRTGVSGLCQVRCLHMLILAARTSASQGEKSSS